MSGKRIAIVGAGPIGLEAALHGQSLGHRVQVYERGTIGENMNRWGHVTLFFILGAQPLRPRSEDTSGSRPTSPRGG